MSSNCPLAVHCLVWDRAGFELDLDCHWEFVHSYGTCCSNYSLCLDFDWLMYAAADYNRRVNSPHKVRSRYCFVQTLVVIGLMCRCIHRNICNFWLWCQCWTVFFSYNKTETLPVMIGYFDWSGKRYGTTIATTTTVYAAQCCYGYSCGNTVRSWACFQVIMRPRSYVHFHIAQIGRTITFFAIFIGFVLLYRSNLLLLFEWSLKYRHQTALILYTINTTHQLQTLLGKIAQNYFQSNRVCYAKSKKFSLSSTNTENKNCVCVQIFRK